MSERHRGTAATHPIPARRNLLIGAIQIAAAAAIFGGAAHATSWWQVALLAACFAVLGNSIYALMHEAEHGMLHPDRRVNDGAGVVLALFFPAPFHLLRQGHLHHHRRNRSDDEAFDFHFEGESRLWRWLQLYGVLTGLFWLAIVVGNFIAVVDPRLLNRSNFEFDRRSAALMAALRPRYWRAIRLEAMAAIALHAGIILLLGIPLLTYAIVYFAFGFAWSAMQYVHHFGTERHVLRGTRNLRLWSPIDAIWLHHNWHLNHHLHPTVPWIHLPRLTAPGSPPRGFLPWRYFAMWRGPRRAPQRIENWNDQSVSR